MNDKPTLPRWLSTDAVIPLLCSETEIQTLTEKLIASTIASFYSQSKVSIWHLFS